MGVCLEPFVSNLYIKVFVHLSAKYLIFEEVSFDNSG
jgi:hypothetical protein